LPTPWLRDGFEAIVDPEELAVDLRERLAAEPRAPDLADFDPHGWDWLWWMDVKLVRGGQEWLVYIELVKFVETMLLGGHNALTAEPWRGASMVEQRLGAEVESELKATLPAAPRRDELRRALGAAIGSYLRLRERLVAERGMPLAEELGRQVREILGR
jgi:hypothetical protein